MLRHAEDLGEREKNQVGNFQSRAKFRAPFEIPLVFLWVTSSRVQTPPQCLVPARCLFSTKRVALKRNSDLEVFKRTEVQK